MRDYFSNKYFFNDNSIWGSIKTRKDIEFHFTRLKNLINNFEHKNGGELFRENTQLMEEELGKIEIALIKVERVHKSSYDNFRYTDAEIEELINQYESLSDKVHNIDMKRVCWY